MNSSWRYRCPAGHTAIQTRNSGGYYCTSCCARYPGDPVDAKRETPDGDTSAGKTKIDPLAAVVALYREAGEDSAPAGQVDPNRRRSLAYALKEAAERGYVSVDRSRNPYRYRLTDAGLAWGANAGDGDGLEQPEEVEKAPPSKVLACPECDSSNLSNRRTRGDVRKRWKCKDCKTEFRDPVRRDPKVTPRDTLKGLAKRLSEADPEEVVGE